jgi:predicted phage terminase large subunit-like protein
MIKFKVRVKPRNQPYVNPKKSAAVTKLSLLRSIYKDSFYEFVRAAWHIIIPEAPVWNWHIEYLCNELQEMAERVIAGKEKLYDLIINIPPGTTKSTICSIMFPCWVWTKMPSARFICGSYADRLALDLSRKTRDVIQSEWYRELFPDIVIRYDQNTKGHFSNTKGGSRYAVGVGGSVIGMHGHFLIVDDPIDPAAALSESELKEVNAWMRETLGQRKVNRTISPLILVMQRLHQDDPSGNMLSNKKARVRLICLPAEASDKICPPHLITKYVDRLLDPVRLPKKELDRVRETDLGEYGYSGQYGQNPIPAGGGMFKADKIHIKPTGPAKWRQIMRYWDKAATATGTGAYTVGLKLGQDMDRNWWIIHVIRGRWDTAAREKLILQTAQLDGKVCKVGLEQEPGSGGKESAENTVRMLSGFRVKVNRPTASEGNKTMRADPVSSQVNAGTFYMVEGPWNQDFIDEMKYFPYSKWKDQIDALSGAFSLMCVPNIEIGVW